eukprot:g13534.t1
MKPARSTNDGRPDPLEGGNCGTLVKNYSNGTRLNYEIQDGENRQGKVELKWMGTMDTFKLYAGIAVKLESEGHKALVQAFRESNDGRA